jgi:hypothetical protein
MRFMNVKTSRAGWPMQVTSCVLRRCGSASAISPVERFDGVCFGSVDTREQLALEGFVAGQEPFGSGPPPEPFDWDRTDPTSSQ